MGRLNRTALVALVLVALAQQASAQSLTFSLLGRYLDSLRQQSGIPGMSAAIVQNGTVVWKQPFGFSDVERSIATRSDTPFQIADLTESLSSSLLLEQCMETGHLNLDDSVQHWMPSFSDSTTTVRDLLTHRSTSGTFKYDPSRYAQLTAVIEACIMKNPTPFRLAMTQHVFERLGMVDSVPGQSVGAGAAADLAIFTPDEMSRFSGVLQRLALPYRVSGGNPTLNSGVSQQLNAATGAISTVLDLANYDAALDDAALLHRDTMAAMWTNATTTSGAAMPTGLGWFVQSYNGVPIYWQFGLTQDAYSSLLIKVPSKNLTLILLANSDGLSSPFALQNGDVTASLFAQAFLRLFVG